MMEMFVCFMPLNQETDNLCCWDNSFLKAIKKYFNCFNLICKTTKCSSSHCLHKKHTEFILIGSNLGLLTI